MATILHSAALDIGKEPCCLTVRIQLISKLMNRVSVHLLFLSAQLLFPFLANSSIQLPAPLQALLHQRGGAWDPGYSTTSSWPKNNDQSQDNHTPCLESSVLGSKVTPLIRSWMDGTLELLAIMFP